MQIWTADLERTTGKCRHRPSISDCLRRPLSAFSVWSRWLFPCLVHGCHPRAIFPTIDTFDEREERKGEEERGDDALLRHSITSPFKNACRYGSPSRPLTKRHRPRWSMVCPPTVGWVFCLCGCPNQTTNKQSRARIRMAFPLSLLPSVLPPFLGSLGHSPPVQARTSHTSHALGRDIRDLSPGEFYMCSNYNLAGNRSTRWKRVTQLGHPIYPFFNQNLFFFFFFRRVSHSPPAAPQHSREEGVVLAPPHTFSGVMDPDPDPQLPPFSLPLLLSMPDQSVGRIPTYTQGGKTRRCGGSLDAANGSNWRMCVALAPALIHQEFRFVACNCNACVSIRASDWKSLVQIRIFFLLITKCHVSLYNSRHFHPRSSRFDQFCPKNGFLHHKATAASEPDGK